MNLNITSLAYIGDAVYELLIRKYLVLKGCYTKPFELEKASINYVSAVSQEKILDKILALNILTDEELNLIKRARNHTPKSKPRHVSVTTYKKATALEALFGFLYLNNKTDDITKLIDIIIGE